MLNSGHRNSGRVVAGGRRHLPAALVFVALILAVAPATALAGASLLPTKGKIWAGVSDTGKIDDFNRFAQATGKHPAVIETFQRWGMGRRGSSAYDRWANAQARPMLHISTTDRYGGTEVISPEQIATGTGPGGDDYLMRLNAVFGGNQIAAFIRPLGEMNGYLNPYCAFNGDGTRRGPAHSTAWFKKAWKRIVIVTRGGGRLFDIDARLAAEGLPPLSSQDGAFPDPLPGETDPYFPLAPVSFVWTPQYFGNPNVKGNQPADYWPGPQWVDWVGTDFTSVYPYWKQFESFYKRFHSKPFAIGEWSVAGRDDPRFVSRFLGWVSKHKAVRMLVYYQGFGGADRYSPYQYPKMLGQLNRQLRSSRYPAYAPEWSI